MGDDYCCSQKRSKGKDKRKKNRDFPYHKGGKHRSENISTSK